MTTKPDSPLLAALASALTDETLISIGRGAIEAAMSCDCPTRCEKCLSPFRDSILAALRPVVAREEGKLIALATEWEAMAIESITSEQHAKRGGAYLTAEGFRRQALELQRCARALRASLEGADRP